MLEKAVMLCNELVAADYEIEELEVHVTEETIVIYYHNYVDPWKRYKAVYTNDCKNKLLYKWVLKEYKLILKEERI